ISFAIFLRRAVVTQVGDFDEQLGLGAATPWSSGEEVDYLIRAVRAGASVEYEPSFTVVHEDKALDAESLRRIGHRDGSSVGYIPRKQQYPAGPLTRMLGRPLGGALLSLARRDVPRACFHAATLRGRVAGYRGTGAG